MKSLKYKFFFSVMNINFQNKIFLKTYNLFLFYLLKLTSLFLKNSKRLYHLSI